MLVLALGIDLPITIMLQVQMMVIVMVTIFNVDSSSTVTGTCSSAISKPQIPTLATTEMDISALPSKTRKGQQGAANSGTLVYEKQDEELHLYLVALGDIEVGTEICYSTTMVAETTKIYNNHSIDLKMHIQNRGV